MMRMLNWLGSVLVVLVLVVAPPIVVAVWLAHRRWSWPSTAQLRGWLENPPPDTAILTLLTTAAALLWLLAAAVTVRVAALHTARAWRRLRRMPLPSPAQATAGSLAGTALLGLPALAPTPATTAPATAPTATVPAAGLPQPGHHPGDQEIRYPLGTHQPAGVDLPDGGWIPHHTAENVAAMVGLFWLRRRQAYQPTTDRHRQHTDHPPPLPAITNFITATRSRTDQMPTTGTDPGRPIPGDRLPTGDVTLTGTGAHAAVRGLLVTTLMTPSNGRPAEVVITDRDLDTLLGQTHTDARRAPGLHVTDDANTTLRQLATATSENPDRKPGTPPRILHITSQRPPPTTRRDTAGDETAVTTVTFGAAAAGDVIWHVNTDGTLTSPPGQPAGRLCILTAHTAADLLSLITQAYSPSPGATGDPATGADQPAPAGDHTVVQSTSVRRPARLTVLGTCQLSVHNQPVPVRRSAAWQILVLLALRPHGATAHHIIETIWPGLTPRTITNRLYTTLNDLRTQLRPSLNRPLIIRAGHHYTLDPEVADVDLWHLQAAATAAATAITTAERRRADRNVIENHHGELADGQNWYWLAAAREPIRQAVIDAYTDLTEGLPTVEAVHLLRDAILVDPYNENLHRRAIQALTDLGDHTAATKLYDTYTLRITTASPHPVANLTDPAGRVRPSREEN